MASTHSMIQDLQRVIDGDLHKAPEAVLKDFVEVLARLQFRSTTSELSGPQRDELTGVARNMLEHGRLPVATENTYEPPTSEGKILANPLKLRLRRLIAVQARIVQQRDQAACVAEAKKRLRRSIGNRHSQRAWRYEKRRLELASQIATLNEAISDAGDDLELAHQIAITDRLKYGNRAGVSRARQYDDTKAERQKRYYEAHRRTGIRVPRPTLTLDECTQVLRDELTKLKSQYDQCTSYGSSRHSATKIKFILADAADIVQLFPAELMQISHSLSSEALWTFLMRRV